MSKKNTRIQKSSTLLTKSNTGSNHQSPNTNHFFSWIDDNILVILSAFLIAFIPLYPKIPLADLIPGYIVRLRLEDLFVAFTAGIFAIQVLRKKVEWKSTFTWFIGAYAIIGLLSTFSAVVITKTVPAEPLHIGKTLLHYFRYLEYFSLFFITYAATKTRKQVYLFLGIIAATVFGVALYGFGQKYYYWPVYSTMNREFSKGMRLYLTEHARVQSTFGGHYDMSAYLVIVLPIILSIAYWVKKIWVKVPLFIAFFAGLWLTIMGASRSSVGALFLSIGIVVTGYALLQSTWKKRIYWGISRSLCMTFAVGLMLFMFGDSIYERFLQTLQGYPELHNTYHGLNDTRKKVYQATLVTVGLADVKLPAGQKPENGMSTEELENIIVSSDTQPTPRDPNIPSDVYVDVPEIVWEATVEGGVATFTATEKPRTYSENASNHGLSMAIRLDTLWPRALQGFYTNPLLGSGYATLTKETRYQFTEAESTDNNYLRTLGETGLLGFITFYGTVVVAIFISLKTYFFSKESFAKALSLAFLAGTAGLLFNAIFIDVFAASKVAFTYWTVTGILAAVLHKHISFASEDDEKIHA